jgi:hypothetical protein
MKPEVQNKIDVLIALSKQAHSTTPVVIINSKSENDGLSKSIRTKRDAEIFMNELEATKHSSKPIKNR